MKLPATESKTSDEPKTTQLTSTGPKAAKAKSLVQTPAKRLANSLASIVSSVASTSSVASPAVTAQKEKNQKEKIQKEKIQEKQTQKGKNKSEKIVGSQHRESIAQDKPHDRKAQGSKSPVPNIAIIKNSKAARVTFTLLLVRPWVLVASLWLVSLLGAAIAVRGLIKPRSLMTALPEAVVEAPPVVTSSIINVADGDIDTETTSSEAAADADSIASSAVASSAENATDKSFPGWSVGALVGTCAAGCLVMSRRRAMARMAVARAKSRVRKKTVRTDVVRANVTRAIETAQDLKGKPAVAAGSAGRKRKANLRPVGVGTGVGAVDERGMSKVKKRRQRNRRPTGPVPAIAQKSTQKSTQRSTQNGAHNSAVKGTRVLVSRSTAQKTAQKTAASTHPVRARRVKRSSARMARRQAMVSVVPAGESHALDWTNGSLAHQMDVRPQRRAAM
ncbi:MAG: hypothetical protein AAF703_07780 [Cyanobacteria bacterium P01_D01_bin.105]